MNNERDGWDNKGNSIETNPKDELHSKGNKKNYKFKDGERNYEYTQYRKHPKKNDYNEKGKNNNENTINKKNNKKKRESNYEIIERFTENIKEIPNEINNQIVQDERIKLKNLNQPSQNNTKKNYFNHNNNSQINNIINNVNEQNQKNMNQFNFYQDNSLHNINYMNNPNNNNQSGVVKNYNRMLNQTQFRKFNNIKQNNNNKGKNNNNKNNTNVNMTKSTMQISNVNSLENQKEQNSNLNIENSQNNNNSINSDNLSIKNQSYYSDRACAPLPNYGNEIFINNINQPIPPYMNEQMYHYNRIPINVFNIPPLNQIEQNNLFNYSPFTLNPINPNQNIVINNNNENIKDNKKNNNVIGKNKGNRNNQSNKILIPNNNNNNNTNLNFNNTINGGLYINQNQNPHYKKNINKKLGLRKLNSDKSIPMNNIPIFPQRNINNKIINQNIQKEEQISPFNNLILKIKLPNGNELIDDLNINLLEEDYKNVAQKYVNNNNLNPILIDPIYNKIINSLKLTKNIFSNNTTKYERKKLKELRNYYLNMKDDDELSVCSIEDILECNKYYEMIKDLKPNKKEINNFEILNYTF